MIAITASANMLGLNLGFVTYNNTTQRIDQLNLRGCLIDSKPIQLVLRRTRSCREPTLSGPIQAMPPSQAGVLKDMTPDIAQNRLKAVETNLQSIRQHGTVRTWPSQETHETDSPKELENVQKMIPTVSPQLCCAQTVTTNSKYVRGVDCRPMATLMSRPYIAEDTISFGSSMIL
jgi:hypothetical protein